MTDQTLRQKVIDELNWEPSVNAAHIGVTAHGGVVTLTGHVDSFAEKCAAEHGAGRVSGVKAIAEELEVRYPFMPAHGDEDVATRVVNVLTWDVFVPRDKVRVKVEKGRVTLTGEVAWQYQKQSTESAIRRLSGVTGVVNEITIKPSVNASVLHDDIKAALGRNAEIEAGNVTVTSNGGQVTLSGKVHSFHERNLAEVTAWSAAGVTHVKDLLTVN